MDAIDIFKGYKKTISLAVILILITFVLCRTIISRPAKLLKEQKRLQVELATYSRQTSPSNETLLPEMQNLDVIVMKEITDGNCVIIQGKSDQIVTDNDLELVQYEFAFSGNYPCLMAVWQNISSKMTDAARITHCRIASERDKDRKGWSLVCRLTIQTIRTK